MINAHVCQVIPREVVWWGCLFVFIDIGFLVLVYEKLKDFHISFIFACLYSFYFFWFSLTDWFGLTASNHVWMYVCMIAKEWLFLPLSINLNVSYFSFRFPLGNVLSAYLTSTNSLAKLHVAPFKLSLPLPTLPKIISKIWSEVINWQPVSQIHSADVFLLQWLLWVVLFCFYLCSIF